MIYWLDEDGAEHCGPSLAESPRGRWAGFQDWWEGVVFHNVNGFNLTRKMLVTVIRNQDGGSHVDPEIRSASYDRFVRVGDHTEYFFGDRSRPVTIKNRGHGNVHLKTMRQVAWELEHSLRQYGVLI